MMQARIALPEEYNSKIDIINPYLQKFIDKSEGESTKESIRDRVNDYIFQCWLITDDDKLIGVCITKIDYWMSYNSLHIIGLGSDKHSWDSFSECHKALEEFARGTGCDRITNWSRPGWKVLFKKKGFVGVEGEEYEHAYDILQMKLKK